MTWPGLILVWLLLACTAEAATQESLDSVRQLYASADYEATLAAIGRLDVAVPAAEAIEVDRYRAMCLIALGRTDEADAAIERIALADPRYEPDAEEAAPRVRAAFKTVRRRVLPGIARTRYAEGKAAYDRQAFADAIPLLESALDIILNLPDTEPGMADLRTLAAGFIDLSRASLARAEAEAEAEAKAAASAAAARQAAEAVPPPPPPPPTEPVVLQQTLPPWNPSTFGSQNTADFRGTVEVDIDERGNVLGSRIIESIHPAYDPVLLQSALTWKYEPARVDGTPIKSSKRVEVVLRPR